MFDMFGGASNPLEPIAQMQTKQAQMATTALQMQQINEKVKQSQRDADINVLNGLTSTVEKIRI